MKKITIIHVFPDDKFLDGFADLYDSLDGVENRYIFYTKDRDYKFKLIKNTSRITVVNSFIKYIKLLRKDDVDIVFFHSMGGIKLFFASILRKKTKVIWWSWGFDLYHSRNYLPPVIKLEMYQPLTKSLMDSLSKPEGLYNRICRDTIGKVYALIRYKAISRVNLLLPVCPIEYSLLKENCKYFKGMLGIHLCAQEKFASKWFSKAGNVLVGNSLTYTNNHLDIFKYLYNVELGNNRQFVIPVSYGGDYVNADHLIKLSKFKEGNVLWLKDYMNICDYNSLLNTVTHAVFGMIRQQALGNILYCLRSGVKIYLYKDSVISKQLKNDGYVFYYIENDLNTESLRTCLSKEDAIHNTNVYNALQNNHGCREILAQLRNLVG